MPRHKGLTSWSGHMKSERSREATLSCFTSERGKPLLRLALRFSPYVRLQYETDVIQSMQRATSAQLLSQTELPIQGDMHVCRV